MKPAFDAYVKSKTAVPMYANAADTRGAIGYLLWGDGVRYLQDPQTNGRRRVRARGRTGWVGASALGGKSLLELYFIDVGQGDGVLVKTPDFRHLLIDGGYPRAQQPSRKSAADFVDWKFVKDYGSRTIELDGMIASHNDFDHYGGLDDLLDAAQNAELDAKAVTVEHFFHAGISWWLTSDGRGRTLGRIKRKAGKEYLIDLLNDRASAEAAIDGTSTPQLQGAWRNFIRNVAAAKNRAGNPTPIARLSQRTSYLPGFEPGTGGPVIHVLAPIESSISGAPALRNFGAPSLTTNGHSILLRLDYGRARLLLTGDLNKAAQQDLLNAYEGRRLEFQCDVAKSCHHGSDDVSFAFLQAMNPSATIISSGDAEGHDHPRPRIVAASGLTGHMTVKNDEIMTPLVYSTELARSTLLGDMRSIKLTDGNMLDTAALARSTINYVTRKPGSLSPTKGSRSFETTYVVAGLVYGLVNVRTDGDTILCATMNEGNASWSIRTFKSRF
jgi:beta-lactamase superfamily II metal-dependent hydrolase